jgi:hypothetical protein
MLYWEVDKKEDAQRLYNKAVERIDKTKPEDEAVRRFREEAEKLLGVPVKPPAAKEKQSP